MIVLIDTNVILDYSLEREPFYHAAKDCLEGLVKRGAPIYLTANSITDIYYIMRRNLINASTARAVTARLLDAFSIVPVDRADCINALSLDMPDFEDALMVACAKKVRASYIITRDEEHFAFSTVKAVAPEKFLETTSST